MESKCLLSQKVRSILAENEYIQKYEKIDFNEKGNCFHCEQPTPTPTPTPIAIVVTESVTVIVAHIHIPQLTVLLAM